MLVFKTMILLIHSGVQTATTGRLLERANRPHSASPVGSRKNWQVRQKEERDQSLLCVGRLDGRPQSDVVDPEFSMDQCATGLALDAYGDEFGFRSGLEAAFQAMPCRRTKSLLRQGVGLTVVGI